MKENDRGSLLLAHTSVPVNQRRQDKHPADLIIFLSLHQGWRNSLNHEKQNIIAASKARTVAVPETENGTEHEEVFFGPAVHTYFSLLFQTQCAKALIVSVNLSHLVSEK